jgi:hypothetical protein
VRTSPIIAVLVLTACLDSKVQSDFNVDLVVQAPFNQEPINNATTVGIVLRGSDVRVIDPADTEGADEALELGPLTDTRLGLVGAESLTDIPAASVFSYGDAGPFTLAREAEPWTVDVLVAEVERIGNLGALSGSQTALNGAVAVASTGDAFLFGGVSTTGAPSDAISRLTDLDAGSWSFTAIGAMPGGPRVGASATPVDMNGAEAILVVGGQSTVGDADTALDASFLLSTSDGLVAWSGTSRSARSGHRSVLLANGRVMLIGGVTQDGDGLPTDTATFEVFDPGFQVFNSGASPLDIPTHGFAVADVGSEGVFVCGGHTLTDDAPQQAVPSSACNWISPLGAVRSAPDLPVPLTGLAMAGIGERHVVATGGLTGPRDSDEATTASAQVFLYTLASDSWQEVEPLVSPRAHHSAVSSVDGRVVLVGGVGRADVAADTVSDPVTCTEVYDQIDRSINEGGCSDTGSGAHLAHGIHPDHGAVVFSGGGTAGQGYGIIPFPPLF